MSEIDTEFYKGVGVLTNKLKSDVCGPLINSFDNIVGKILDSNNRTIYELRNIIYILIFLVVFVVGYFIYHITHNKQIEKYSPFINKQYYNPNELNDIPTRNNVSYVTHPTNHLDYVNNNKISYIGKSNYYSPMQNKKYYHQYEIDNIPTNKIKNYTHHPVELYKNNYLL